MFVSWKDPVKNQPGCSRQPWSILRTAAVFCVTLFAVSCSSGFFPSASAPEADGSGATGGEPSAGTEPVYDDAAPAWIRQKAWDAAQEYFGMEYEYGGQDFPVPKGIDCSGFIVNVYYTATRGTAYSLPFTYINSAGIPDASSADLYAEYSIPLETPSTGDLVFMRYGNSAPVDHVALLDRIENGVIYFMDASDAGVTERWYFVSDPHIVSYGRLRLKKTGR